MRRTLHLLALALLAPAGDAAADDCGDGSSTADLVFGVLEAVTQSGDSSDADAHKGPAEAVCTEDGKGCEDDDGPPISIEIGTAVRSFVSPLGERTGQITHEGESFSYRVVGPGSSRPDTAFVAQLRIAVGLRYGFYVGGEGEGGMLTANNVAAEMTSSGTLGTPDITPASVTAYGGAAIAGIGHRLGPIDLGLESAGGFRALAYHYHSDYLACSDNTSITAAQPVLEGRARAAVWVSSEISLGATYGRSLIDESSLGGLYLRWATPR